MVTVRDASCSHHLSPYRVVRADLAGGEVIGAARSRCDPGSRWVGYTFQRRDVGKSVKAGPGTGSGLVNYGVSTMKMAPGHLGISCI